MIATLNALPGERSPAPGNHDMPRPEHPAESDRTADRHTATTDLLDSLSAARQIVHTTAYVTIRATPNARRALAHIDAAQHLMTAAVELFAAALDIAAGASIKGHGATINPKASGSAISLRIAEAKMREAREMLDMAERRQGHQRVLG